MKRQLVSALIIGLIVGGIVMGLHVSGWLLRPELALTDLLSRDGSATKLIGDRWQYVIVFALALGVAWLTLATSRRSRLGWILAILLVEVVGVAWVCSLYHVFFQPLPALLAAASGFSRAALGYLWFVGYLEERRSRPPKLKPIPEVRVRAQV